MRAVSLLPLLLIMNLILTVGSAHAECEGDTTDGDDHVDCETTSDDDYYGGIDTGAGNDTVDIGEDAEFVGNVITGPGDDTVNNEGQATWVYTDNFAEHSSGSDTVNNDGMVLEFVDAGPGDDTINNGPDGHIGGVYGKDGDDTITNEGVIVQVEAGAGDDTVVITVDGEVAATVFGNAGSDVIQNDGTVAWIYGDTYGTHSSDGDDQVINNGSVTEYIQTNGGNDEIINNGDVGLSIHANLGADIVVNNGTIGGDIHADFEWDFAGGTDQVTNSGTVGGSIYTGANDDVVTLLNNARVIGVIDGGTGRDQLILGMTVTVRDQQEADAVAALIAGASPNGGTINIGGQNYTWSNFEELSNAIQFIIEAITNDPGGETPGEDHTGGPGGTPGVEIPLVFKIGVQHGGNDAQPHAPVLGDRINHLDVAAPLAGYCTQDHGIAVYDVDGSGSGAFAFSVGAADIAAALQAATTSGTHILIAGGSHNSLWALASNELQFHQNDGQYDHVFAAARCDA